MKKEKKRKDNFLQEYDNIYWYPARHGSVCSYDVTKAHGFSQKFFFSASTPQ